MFCYPHRLYTHTSHMKAETLSPTVQTITIRLKLTTTINRYGLIGREAGNNCQLTARSSSSSSRSLCHSHSSSVGSTVPVITSLLWKNIDKWVRHLHTCNADVRHWGNGDGKVSIPGSKPAPVPCHREAGKEQRTSALVHGPPHKTWLLCWHTEPVASSGHELASSLL